MTQINRRHQLSPGSNVSVRELVLRERIYRESVLIYGLAISITAGLCAAVIFIAVLLDHKDEWMVCPKCFY